MKNLIKYLFFILSSIQIHGQNWLNNIPQQKQQSGNVTFYDYQNAFYQEFPTDSFPNGTRIVNK